MAMSEANVETVRRFTELLMSGDYDAAAALLHPDFTVDDNDIPEATGADSLHAWIGRWDDSFRDWRIEGLEVRAISETRTLQLFKIFATGRASGVELARDDASIADFRDGKIVRIAYYYNHPQAIADAER
jgi:ketosteroid isomerase-like protein